MTSTRGSVGGVAVASAGPNGAAGPEVLARVAGTFPGADRVAEAVTGTERVARTATHAGDVSRTEAREPGVCMTIARHDEAHVAIGIESDAATVGIPLDAARQRKVGTIDTDVDANDRNRLRRQRGGGATG